MIKLSDGGAYLINGVDIVEDSASAVNEVAAKTGFLKTITHLETWRS